MSQPVDQIVGIGARLADLGVHSIPLERTTSNGTTNSLEGEALSSAVREALAQPLAFPPLAQATVPGDHAAIAADETIPNLLYVVIGAIQALNKAGIDSDHISVVAADAKACGHLQSSLAERELPDVCVVNHDPTQQHDLCFVGTTRAGRTLLINRTLFEADVVLPVSCCRWMDESHTASAYSGLYPRFSDIETIRRWSSAEGSVDEATADQLAEADEAGWLLGAPLIVQVVPGAHGRVAHVIAGDAQQVAHESARHYQHLWWTRVPQRCSLAIVTVSGDDESHGWQHVARAAQTAEGVLNENGALAVCCGRLPSPGKSFRQLAEVAEFAAAQRRMNRKPDENTWAARCLSQALERGPVYIFSQSDAEMVEEMGMAPVQDITELARLAKRHESCVVLEDAEHIVVRVEDEIA